jgi:hypothetical protein
MMEPDRTKMNEAIELNRNSLENTYLAGYYTGKLDAEHELGVMYTINVLNQLAYTLRSEIKDRGYSSYIADGVWIALREIDDLKDAVRAGGKCDDRK